MLIYCRKDIVLLATKTRLCSRPAQTFANSNPIPLEAPVMRMFSVIYSFIIYVYKNSIYNV
jgi:hypothetical protein